MRKLFFMALSISLLTACNNEKKDDKKTTETTSSSTGETKAAPTGQDAELTQWLSGKKLISTRKDPQYDMWNNMQLKGDGSCVDKDNATAKWSVKDGKFIFESVMNMTKDMEKKDDTTLVFKGAVGDDLYILKPIN